MKHRDKIESLVETEIKRRKVMKLSRFIVEAEKRRFCQEVVKFQEEKREKIDRFFCDENLIYQNAKRTKDCLVVIATNKQTRETFYIKQFRRKVNFENEKQILHIFKQDENNPFLDLIQMDNSRMLLKKKGERYSLIDFAYSINHQWEQNELIFIFEKLLQFACDLKREGVYLGDYDLENISLKDTSKESGRFTLKLINADKAVQKKGVLSYNLSSIDYVHPQLQSKNSHLSTNEMEASDIWSIARCICLLISELDIALCPNNYSDMYEFMQQTLQSNYPILYQLILAAIYSSDQLIQKSNFYNTQNTQKNTQISKNISLQIQKFQQQVSLKQFSFEGLLDFLQNLANSQRMNQLKCLENRELNQKRPLSKFSQQMDLYQFLMKANLYENAVETIERVLQESNSVHEREVLLLNLDYIYCLYKIGMKYKGEMRLKELESSFLKYSQYDFEMLYKFSLASIVYEKNNINDLFNKFPQIIQLEQGNKISRHYLFYLLQCQLVLKYFETGKSELGLMYNQIAIDYAYDNIILHQNESNNIIVADNNRLVTFDNFTEYKEDNYLEELIDPYRTVTENNEDDEYSNVIQNKLKQVNLGICEDNLDLIGQYLFLMEEYDIAISKITDLQTRAACFFYQEKYQQAIKIYEGMKDMIHFQSDPSIYLALVMCYYLIQDYQKAYQYCIQSIIICDRQEKSSQQKNQQTNQFTKGEEQAYREYKAKLNERSRSYHQLHSSASQKDFKDKKEKQYQKIYEQYNFKASALVLKAFCEMEIGRVETSIENMKYAIDHFERVGLVYEKIDMQENLSLSYLKQSFTTPSASKRAQETTLEAYNAKLRLMQQTGRFSIEIDFPDSLNLISLSYLNVLDFKNAIKYSEQALDLILDQSEIPNTSYVESDQDNQNAYLDDEEDIYKNGGYFRLLWKQYLFIGLLYDNTNNNEKVIVCAQKALQMLRQCSRTIQNAEEEIHIYLLLAHVKKTMSLFEDSLRYYVKAIDTAEILSRIEINQNNQENIMKKSRISLLHLQCLSFALSVYSSEKYNSSPSNGRWCAQKMEKLLFGLKQLKYEILPKYYLQLSQYEDLINDTPHAIELAKTAAILHQEVYNSTESIPPNELKTRVIIYNTLVSMLQHSRRNKEAESYLLELQKFE
ncbi:tetratricopeptide repeat protein (macronuclear) [Tetrahymena thermophila SB210]|uniref:Tetratricopeptide repeat protein n=1 Tax=Tetrahymena thermophila (strain SB210) TaxID=312017 RepID=Q246D2_TETTS|nr:tetratricopeptide repeat protein [Tetrahymena thermophila SB210]EAS03451.1 tetratricopeptide repeat protein [Tetrahymena thermophila SB210]|eukprot:XP_001023696.1 tetratricopeptide repeat protein [Tetrahymena thermophila SB210]